MGYISIPSILNAIIGITSYYCVILKILILDDAIKAIQNAVFPFSLKKGQNLVSFIKTKKRFIKTKKRFFFKTKKQVDCFLFFFKKKKTGFSQP